MLTLAGRKYSLCDRLPRRNFLKVGAAAWAGLSLPQLLRAEEQGARHDRHKAVIMVFLPGGPSHIDTLDPKPEAPAEIRGEFAAIASRVPGIDVCEHLPQMAAAMDKFVLIRSIVGAVDDHACHVCFTGFPRQGPVPAGGRPSLGAAVSKVLGPLDAAMPPAVNLSRPMLHPPYNDPGPGFLGVGHAAFRPDGQSLDNMTLNGVAASRFRNRQELLSRFDRIRREIDTSGTWEGMDTFNRRAFELVTSPRMRNALDLSTEDPKVVARYGPDNPELVPEFNAAPRMTSDFLTSRRLIDAGARCVTVSFGAWDWHYTNFSGHRSQLPYLDRGLSALVEDLHARGMDRDVLVVAWGEFGRSPRMNKAAGRDHWPGVSCAVLAGGGLSAGQVIGSTNRWGESPHSRPVHVQDVLATVYDHLQIDAAQLTIPDLAGRPQYLLDRGEVIRELRS